MNDSEWISATIGIALRSTLAMHKTGCIIVNRDNEVVSTGWSHMSDTNYAKYYSVHAEFHALNRLPKSKNDGRLRAYVATVSGRRQNQVTIGRPCFRCASNLQRHGILDIFYTSAGTVDDFLFENLSINPSGKVCRSQFKVYNTPDKVELCQ